MQSIIAVVAELPTRVEWLEKHYPHCELTWSKSLSEFMELFPEIERSGRLQVILSEEPFRELTRAMVLGPTQLSMGYSESDMRMLIGNALTVSQMPVAVSA